MLAKKHRLTSKDLKEVRGFSFYRSELFDVKDFRGIEGRFAVILGTKVYKKAVERNKTKRLFYRILRELTQENPHLLSYSCAVFPKKGVLTNDYTSIKAQLSNALLQKYV